VDPRVVLDAVVKRKIPNPRRESDPRYRRTQHIIDWQIQAEAHAGRIAEKGRGQPYVYRRIQWRYWNI